MSGPIGTAAIHGLKIVALAVVAHGLLGMVRTLTPDWQRRTIAVAAVTIILVTGNAWMQLAAIALGGIAGLWLCRHATSPEQSVRVGYSTRRGVALIALFGLMLVGLPLLASMGPGYATVDAFYRAGSLVFGGGHVVLPLLEETVVAPGWVSDDAFLAGYGAAQAVPGPMFTIASYLGVLLPGSAGGVTGGIAATLAVFLPGFLLLAGILPLWQSISSHPAAAHVVAGVNAAVVGLLGAALYDPVWTSAAQSIFDVAIAAIALILLARWNVSALWIVGGCVAARILVELAGSF